MGEAAAYYPFDVSPAATALKIEGLSGIQAVNSFSALSYTKVGQPRGYDVVGDALGLGAVVAGRGGVSVVFEGIFGGA